MWDLALRQNVGIVAPDCRPVQHAVTCVVHARARKINNAGALTAALRPHSKPKPA